jgi:hypothetical protein
VPSPGLLPPAGAGRGRERGAPLGRRGIRHPGPRPARADPGGAGCLSSGLVQAAGCRPAGVAAREAGEGRASAALPRREARRRARPGRPTPGGGADRGRYPA